MQILKEEVRQNILNCSRQMFLESGYEKTSMRMIAKQSGITVGNIYNYYQNKEELFDAIVGDTYKKLVKMINVEIATDLKTNSEEFHALRSDIVDQLMEILLNHQEDMLILLSGSKGTKYESVESDFIELIAKRLLQESTLRIKNKRAEINMDYLSYVTARGFYMALVDTIVYFDDEEELKKHMSFVFDFYFEDLFVRIKE